MTTPYFEDLAERLRGSGVPADEVAGTVDDLAAYIAESGSAPEEEFGPVEEFAARLVPSEGGAWDGGSPPDASAQTWRWTADAFQDRKMLNRFGDEGWEVERVDSVGRFVCRRDGERPQRWEYRRETVLPGRRKAVEGRLAPDGWEPCGTWVQFEYFKRAKAASLGPDAELQAPPDMPAKRFFWSKRFYTFVACYAVFIIAVCGGWLAFAPEDSRTGFLVGFLLGAAIAAVLMTMRLWREHRRTAS
ncbi:hypothetical protein [Actinomadura napierensis]|uniref:DUF2812 domain-containing protein n=1 Tax=Actinomadura napierensis TaxID=267854 RepID=A0ABN3AGG2_9ACTN